MILANGCNIKKMNNLMGSEYFPYPLYIIYIYIYNIHTHAQNHFYCILKIQLLVFLIIILNNISFEKRFFIGKFDQKSK